MGHTPARNVQVLTPGVLEDTYYPSVGAPSTSYYSRPQGRFHDSRPQSIHTAPNGVGRFTAPAGWVHYGGKTSTTSWYKMSLGPSGYYIRKGEFGYWEPQGISNDVFYGLRRTVLIRALSKAGKTIRQTGVFLREIDEVLALAKRFGNGVNEGLENVNDVLNKSSIARSDMKRFLRHGWKEAPSFYLAYLFGVAPLAEDLQAAVSALNDLRGLDAYIDLRLRSKHESVDVVEKQLQGFFGQVTGYTKLQLEYTARAQLTFRMPSAKLRAFEFITPFSEAWETTRLSFVLDYILPIGNWLTGLESAQIAPFFLNGTYSLKIRQTPFGGSRVVSSYPIQGFEISCAGEYNQYVREVLSGFPYESIFKPPSFQLPDVRQLGVLGALIGQQLSKLYKTVNRAETGREAMDRAAARRRRKGRGSSKKR